MTSPRPSETDLPRLRAPFFGVLFLPSCADFCASSRKGIAAATGCGWYNRTGS
ncbi:hypothetical protein OH686_13720 [Pseudomonas sp. SO81]|nr:hypothetical protein OH686_13720 [Pseudomonas sp. SO81]